MINEETKEFYKMAINMMDKTIDSNKNIKQIVLGFFWKNIVGKEYKNIPVRYESDMFLNQVSYD